MKKEELCNCSSHDEIIKLTKSWELEIDGEWVK